MTDGDMTRGAEQYKGFLTKKGVASHFYHSNDTMELVLLYRQFSKAEIIKYITLEK